MYYNVYVVFIMWFCEKSFWIIYVKFIINFIFVDSERIWVVKEGFGG